jgi:hypothetical protein
MDLPKIVGLQKICGRNKRKIRRRRRRRKRKKKKEEEVNEELQVRVAGYTR